MNQLIDGALRWHRGSGDHVDIAGTCERIWIWASAADDGHPLINALAVAGEIDEIVAH